ncbi:MAG: C25 family cysteine peptidase, partial [Flavobacteriales bacterium]
MKKLLLLSSCFIFSHLAMAQPYGNEWINYNQKYLKVKVVTDGLYRIDFSALYPHFLAMNVDTASFDPRNFQLFGHGQEQYIYVAGEDDGHFDPGDYLVFYAEHNDGWLDSLLYTSPAEQTNPYFSLITDTAAYYITWNSSTSNRRFEPHNDTQYSSYTADTYYYAEVIEMKNQSYEYGALGSSKKKDSYYTAGEGWLSNKFGYLGHQDYNISTPGAYTGGPSANVSTVTVSLSDATQNPDHHLLIEFGPTYGSTAINTTYNGYQMNKFDFSIPPSQFGTTTKIRFNSASLVPAPASDYTAVAYVRVKYPHSYDMQGAQSAKMNINANSGKTYIKAVNFTSQPTYFLYDLTGHYRIQVVQNGTTVEALVPSGGEKELFLACDAAINDLSASDIIRAGNNGTLTNYALIDPDSAFIIISCDKLINEASIYSTYRQSKGFNVVLINIDDDLYDQFSYGIAKHPLSIRGFADYVSDVWSTQPQ